MTEIHIKDRSDLTYRLMLVASMKRGDLFPPPGYARDDPDWQENGWDVGMSKLLTEARLEIFEQREAVADLRAVGRWLLGVSVGLLLTCAVLAGILIGNWR